MYEAEANRATESVQQVPPDVVARFLAFREEVVARTVLPWGEHCTECVWPTCYTTCDLYSPREDGRCRRFIDGIVRVDCPGTVNSYLLKIQFKRWGKLWAPGNIHLFPLVHADHLEQRDHNIATFLRQLPLPKKAATLVSLKRYSWKKRSAANAKPSSDTPDLFVIECYNPGPNTIDLSLTMRSSNGLTTIPYQKLISVRAGFHCEHISVREITRTLDLSAPFSVDLIPNDIADGATLFFGLIDFVRSKPKHEGTQQSRIKCIIWDLDNTLWDGVLIEDGVDKLVLKPGIVDTIKELDRRGIIHSVASKNNFDEAMAVLKSQGLDEYFLYPQISWGPKSEAVKAIAKKLNIGIDTMMLVDDSHFELAQVQSSCPGVKVLQAHHFCEIPDMKEFEVPVTEESVNRRTMYRQEVERKSVSESFAGDYTAFLRECRMEMQIERLSASNLERVHELTQRTNQMNFSGNRYERTLLGEIAAARHFDTYVISCRDRFGSYGIVGFSVVDAREPRMIDLMFSCRIQAKRVEHALLTHLLTKYSASGRDFWANYRKTPRNEPSGRVFQDIGMEEVDVKAGVTSLVFRKGCRIPDDGILQIVELLGTDL
jgi:FkbH-like protein